MSITILADPVTLTRTQAIAAARRMWDGGNGGWTIGGIQRYLAEQVDGPTISIKRKGDMLIVLIGAIAWITLSRIRSQRLRQRFGPEYDRTIRSEGNVRKAEAALEARAKRVATLHIRPLDPADAERFDASWRAVQARFVDDPRGAVTEADRLVGEVMTTALVTIGPDADHAEAARLMRKANVKRLPVVDDYGNLVGLVSRTDILRVFIRPDAEIIAEIRERVMRKVLWIDPRPVKVVCEDGNVSLSGTLETQTDAELLVELARRLDGVVSVQDRLTWSVGNSGLEMMPPVPSRRGW